MKEKKQNQIISELQVFFQGGFALDDDDDDDDDDDES